MASHIQISPARSADLDRILTVFCAAIKACDKDYTPAQLEAWLESSKHKLAWLEKLRRQYFLLASINGQLAGFASLEGAYLDFMYVSPAWQRNGVARHLLRHLETEALRNRHTEILTDVSISAQPFFEKQGFVVLRKNFNEKEGEVLLNYRMRKGLIQ